MKSIKELPDVRQMLVVDSLRYSLAMENRAYKLMWNSLRRIERSKARHIPERSALSALANAWQVIDMTHRIRGLAYQVKGFKQKSPAFQLLIRGTSKVVEFRNQLQHLNSYIPSVDGPTNPPMGSIAWVNADPCASHAMTFGRGKKGVSFATLPYSGDTLTFPMQFQFALGGRSINLVETNRDCRHFEEFLTNWLSSSGMLEGFSQKIATIRLRVNPRSPAPPAADAD